MIISSKKYACETCIKGHRSSACKHTDRPLFEIKKKGRPVTQCEHCRELRKTKQVHVKCICESKAESSYSSQQGPNAGFESAAFPNGLPEALGASVAFPSPVEGTSSDSDHGGVHRGHQCKSGDPCTCVTPRTRRPRGDTTAADPQQLSGAGGSSSRRGHASSAHTSQILARIQELRPLVPRPPSSAYSMSGPVHNPSMGIPHGHTLGRHHDSFAPYGRVHGTTPQHNVHPQSYAASPAPSSTSAFSYNEQQMYPDPLQMMGAPPPWGAAPENVGYDSSAAAFPSLCGCGDDCACPGCVHHNRATHFPSSSAYSSCSNPHLCATCLDCTIMSLPATAFLPADTALSISDDQNAAIDDWLRQMSASIASSSDPSSPFHPSQQNYGGGPFQQQQQPQSPGYFPYNDPPPSMGRDPRGMPPSSSNSFNGNANYPSNPNSFSPSGRDRHQGQGQGFPPSASQPRPGHRSRSSMSMPGHGHDAPMIDPRLLPTASPTFHSPRSRSPSASSQSSSSQSHHDADATIHHTSSASTNAGRPSGRMQGLFPPARGGGRAPQAPQLHMDIHPGLARGPGSAASSSASASSVSPSPGSARAYGGSAGGPNSNPNTETGEYDPSLAGLQIY